MDPSSDTGQSLVPLTSISYYNSLREHVIEKEKNGYGVNMAEDDLVLVDYKSSPILYIFRSGTSLDMNYVSEALKICSKGLIFLNTYTNISVQWESITKMLTDDWPYMPLFKKGVSLDSVSKSFHYGTTDKEVTDELSQRSAKRKRIEDHEVFSSEGGYNEIENRKALFRKIIASKIVVDELMIYGLFEIMLKNRYPFTVTPLHCSIQKANVLKKLIVSAKNKMTLLSESHSIPDYCELIIENTFESLSQICNVEAYFNAENEIVPKEQKEHHYSTMFTTCMDTTNNHQNNNNEKAIPPIYINCENRPLHNVNHQILLIRSIFLQLLSYFPNKLPGIPAIKHEHIKPHLLRCLIETDFVISVLTPATAYRSKSTTPMDILRYYFFCLEAISGTSAILSGISQYNLTIILLGKYDIDAIEKRFKQTREIDTKARIRHCLQKCMTPINSFLDVNVKEGTFLLETIYSDGKFFLQVGLKIIEETSNCIVLARNADLGQQTSVTHDFAFDPNVIQNINLDRHGELIAALIVEGTDRIRSTIHLIKTFFPDNKIGNRILDEFVLLDCNSNDITSLFYTIQDAKLLLKNVDLNKIQDQLITHALDVLYQTHNPLISGRYMETNNTQYVLSIENEYHIYPIDDDDMKSIIREIPITSTLYADQIMKWLLHTNYKNHTEKLLMLIQDLNPQAYSLVSSAFAFWIALEYDISFYELILSIIIDVISNESSPIIITNVDTLKTVINTVAKKDIDRKLSLFDSKVDSSFIFVLQNISAYVFYQKNGFTYFLDSETFRPDSGALHALNILNEDNVHDVDKWKTFHEYDISLQQLYWRNLIKTNIDIFHTFIKESPCIACFLKSFLCDNFKIFFYDILSITSIFTMLVKETPLGTQGNILDIISRQFMQNCKKTKFSEHTIFYLSKDNIPILILSDRNKGSIADLLLLHYLIFQNIIGFAFIKKENDNIYKLAMLTDKSENTQQIFALNTIEDIFKFFTKFYGKYGLINIDDIFPCDVEMENIKHRPSYYKESNVLTHLNLWRYEWPREINKNYNILPDIIRYGVCMFSICTKARTYISLSYVSPVNNFLSYESISHKWKEEIGLSDKCLTIIFESPEEVKSTLRCKVMP